MMKKIEKELDQSPKRLRSIMAFSNQAGSSRIATARDNINLRVIDTSYTNNTAPADEKQYAKTSTNGFF